LQERIDIRCLTGFVLGGFGKDMVMHLQSQTGFDQVFNLCFRQFEFVKDRVRSLETRLKISTSVCLSLCLYVYPSVNLLPQRTPGSE
jgi:hypothetical protein